MRKTIPPPDSVGCPGDEATAAAVAAHDSIIQRPWYGSNDDPSVFRAIYLSDWLATRALLRVSSHHRLASAFSDRYGYTCLHLACWLNAPMDIIHSLLSNSSQLTKRRNKKGRTPLHFASWRGTDATVLALLQSCPDAASVLDDNGKSALSDACTKNRSAQIIQTLLQANPSMVHVPNRWERSPSLIFFRSVYGCVSSRMISSDTAEEKGREVWSTQNKEVCDDLMDRIDALLMAEVNGTATKNLCYTHNENDSYHHYWEREKRFAVTLQNAVQGVYCPFVIVQFVLQYIHDKTRFPKLVLRSKNNDGDTVIHIASKHARNFHHSEFYQCDDCRKIQPTARRGIPPPPPAAAADVARDTKHEFMYFNKDPNNAFWGSICNACIRNEFRQNYVRLKPANKSRSTIELLLTLDPLSASIPDKDGRLPLNIILDSENVDWGSGVQALLHAAPMALYTRDIHTHMYPFMIAAHRKSHGNKTHGGAKHCLEKVSATDDGDDDDDCKKDDMGLINTASTFDSNDRKDRVSAVFRLLMEEPTVLRIGLSSQENTEGTD